MLKKKTLGNVWWVKGNKWLGYGRLQLVENDEKFTLHISSHLLLVYTSDASK